MKTFTALELAEALGVEEAEARGLLKFLVAKKMAEFRGERPAEAGQRGMHCFRIDEHAVERLPKMLQRVIDEGD